MSSATKLASTPANTATTPFPNVASANVLDTHSSGKPLIHLWREGRREGREEGGKEGKGGKGGREGGRKGGKEGGKEIEMRSSAFTHTHTHARAL